MRAYQLMSSILAALALLGYEWLTLRLLRKRRDPLVWLVLTALGILASARIGLVAVLHVLLLRLQATQYLEPAYPITLAFSVIAIFAARGILARFQNAGARLCPPRWPEGRG